MLFQAKTNSTVVDLPSQKMLILFNEHAISPSSRDELAEFRRRRIATTSRLSAAAATMNDEDESTTIAGDAACASDIGSLTLPVINPVLRPYSKDEQTAIKKAKEAGLP